MLRVLKLMRHSMKQTTPGGDALGRQFRSGFPDLYFQCAGNACLRDAVHLLRAELHLGTGWLWGAPGYAGLILSGGNGDVMF